LVGGREVFVAEGIGVAVSVACGMEVDLFVGLTSTASSAASVANSWETPMQPAAASILLSTMIIILFCQFT
jgi:hypothetical protein